jgi:hypothetical protein
MLINGRLNCRNSNSDSMDSDIPQERLMIDVGHELSNLKGKLLIAAKGRITHKTK